MEYGGVNYACPKCGTSLERRFVPSRPVPEGTPFYRATDSTQACPECGTPIRRNNHPHEQGFAFLCGVGMLGYAFAAAFARNALWSSAIAAGLVGVAAFWYWYRSRYLRDWPVWLRSEHAEGGRDA